MEIWPFYSPGPQRGYLGVSQPKTVKIPAPKGLTNIFEEIPPKRKPYRLNRHVSLKILFFSQLKQSEQILK